MRYKAEEFTESDLAEAIESVAFLDEPVFEERQLPLQQQVVDKLADMLFASDMVLDMRSSRAIWCWTCCAPNAIAYRLIYSR